jgi:hypothetical protein
MRGLTNEILELIRRTSSTPAEGYGRSIEGIH